MENLLPRPIWLTADIYWDICTLWEHDLYVPTEQTDMSLICLSFSKLLDSYTKASSNRERQLELIVIIFAVIDTYPIFFTHKTIRDVLYNKLQQFKKDSRLRKSFALLETLVFL